MKLKTEFSDDEKRKAEARLQMLLNSDGAEAAYHARMLKYILCEDAPEPAGIMFEP